MKVFKILAVLVLLAAGGFYTSSHFGANGKAPAQQAAPAAAGGRPGAPTGPLPVVTAPVTASSLASTVRAVGSLVAGESADINTEIAGKVQAIMFEEGQSVKKGDVLLKIDDSLIRTELNSAEASLRVTSATFGRDNKLQQSGFVSEQKRDESKASQQAARAAVDNARIRLEKTSVRAPFDGIAGLRSFSVGDFASAGQTLTTIVSVNPLKVEFTVPERNYADIAPGQDITLDTDAYAGRTFAGQVYAVDPRIDTQTRNFTVKANILNEENLLRPGMFARINVTTKQRHDVLTIPEEAIVPRGGENFVFVVTDGKALNRKIETGTREAGRVEIVSGLSAGEEVVTAGTLRLREGIAVAPQQKQQENPAPSEQQPAAGAN